MYMKTHFGTCHESYASEILACPQIGQPGKLLCSLCDGDNGRLSFTTKDRPNGIVPGCDSQNYTLNVVRNR